MTTKPAVPRSKAWTLFHADGTPATREEILRVSSLLMSRAHRKGAALTSPQLTAGWMQGRLHDLEHEVFEVIHLDNHHRIIGPHRIATGTIDSASVYPREVVKAALAANAAAVILVHNHPSGCTDPSGADRRLTDRLRTALQTVDIRVLDHVIVSSEGYFSFAEKGLL